jgi:hypothetical protein
MTIEGQSKYFFSAKKTFVFSLIFLVLFIARGLISIEGVILLLAVFPLAMLFFLAWRDGTQSQIVISITVRALVLCLLFFLLLVLFIKTVSGGQLGYGDALQIRDGYITPLGYKRILISSATMAGSAWIAAIIAAFFQVKRIPRC